MHLTVSTYIVNKVKKRIREMDSHKEFYRYYSDQCEHVLMHLADPEHEPNCKSISYSCVVVSCYAKARRESLLVADWLITQGQLLEAIRLVEVSSEAQAPGPTGREEHLIALIDSILSRRPASRSSDK